MFGFIQRSMERRTKRLLIASADSVRRAALRGTLEAADLNVVEADSRAALAALASEEHPDGVVMDLELQEGKSLELAELIQNRLAPLAPPIRLFGTQKLSQIQEAELWRLGRNGIVRYVSSLERLLDETIAALQRTENELSSEQRRLLDQVRLSDPMLEDRTILVMDDDVRNIFALTSLLEHHHLKVLFAENGRAGIEMLTQHHEVDLLLMDIMMPGMDGYETIRTIRGMPEFESLPMIAVTAKAMKGDRDKCLQAGANDYVAKPVDVENLLSVMRVWIARKHDIAAELAAFAA